MAPPKLESGIGRLFVLSVIGAIILTGWYWYKGLLPVIDPVIAYGAFGTILVIIGTVNWIRNPDSIEQNWKWRDWMKLPKTERAKTLSIVAIISAFIFPIVGPLFGLLLVSRHSGERRFVRIARIVCIIALAITAIVYWFTWRAF